MAGVMWKSYRVKRFHFSPFPGFFSNRGIKNPSVSNPSTSSVLFAHCDQAVRRTWWTNLVIPAACFIQTISPCHYVVTMYLYMRLRRWCPFKNIIHLNYNWVKPQLIMNQWIASHHPNSSGQGTTFTSNGCERHAAPSNAASNFSVINVASAEAQTSWVGSGTSWQPWNIRFIFVI